jgi:hypothetical protein
MGGFDNPFVNTPWQYPAARKRAAETFGVTPASSASVSIEFMLGA